MATTAPLPADFELVTPPTPLPPEFEMVSPGTPATAGPPAPPQQPGFASRFWTSFQHSLMTDPVLSGVIKGIDATVGLGSQAVQAANWGLTQAGASGPFSPAVDTALSFAERPLQSAIQGQTPSTGGKAFPELESALPRLAQRAIAGYTGAVLSTPLLGRIFASIRDIPQAMIEFPAVVSSLAGGGVHEVAPGPVKELATELITGFGAQKALEIAQVVQGYMRKGMNFAQAVQEARGPALSGTERAIQTQVQRTPNLEESQQAVQRVQEMGRNLPAEAGGPAEIPFTLGQTTQNPVLLRAEQGLALRSPEAEAALAAQQQTAQQGMQRVMQHAIGAPESAEALGPVVTAAQAPVRQAQERAAQVEALNQQTTGAANQFATQAGQELSTAQLAQTVAERQLAEARLPLTQETQAATEATQAAEQARTGVRGTLATTGLALRQDLQLARTRLQRAQQIAEQRLKVGAEQIALQPDLERAQAEHPEFATRVGQFFRTTYEQLFQEHRQTYNELYKPFDMVVEGKASVTRPSLAAFEERWTLRGRGDQARGAFAPLEEIIAERASEQGITIPKPPSATALPAFQTAGPPGGAAQALDEARLTIGDLRNARTRILENVRATNDPNEAAVLWDAARTLDGAMETMAQQAGKPQVIPELRALNSMYRDDIRRFTNGPGEVFLRQAAGTTRLPSQTPGAQDYALTPLQALNQVFDNAPVAGQMGRGAAKFADYQRLLQDMGEQAGGLDAIRAYAGQDLYVAAMNPTGTINPQKIQQWLENHRALIDAHPVMQEWFSTVRGRLQLLQETDAYATKMLGELGEGQRAFRVSAAAQQAPLTQAVEQARVTQAAATQRLTSLEAAAEPGLMQQAKAVEQAREQSGAAQQLLKNATATAQDRTAQVKQAVDEALTNYRTTFGEAAAARKSLDIQSAGQMVEGDLGTIMHDIYDLNRVQRKRALDGLMQATGNNEAGKRGILRSMVDEFLVRERDVQNLPEAIQLGQDVAMLDPVRVQRFLNANEAFLQQHFPEHYDNIKALTQGMRMLMVKARAGSVPTDLRGLTPQENLVHNLLYGGVPGVAAHTLGGGILSIPLAIFTGYARKYFAGIGEEKKFRLLQEALFDPKVSTLLHAMQQPATDPRWLRTAMYSTLTRLGMLTQEAEAP